MTAVVEGKFRKDGSPYFAGRRASLFRIESWSSDPSVLADFDDIVGAEKSALREIATHGTLTTWSDEPWLGVEYADYQPPSMEEVERQEAQARLAAAEARAHDAKEQKGRHQEPDWDKFNKWAEGVRVKKTWLRHQKKIWRRPRVKDCAPKWKSPQLISRSRFSYDFWRYPPREYPPDLPIRQLNARAWRTQTMKIWEFPGFDLPYGRIEGKVFGLLATPVSVYRVLHGYTVSGYTVGQMAHMGKKPTSWVVAVLRTLLPRWERLVLQRCPERPTHVPEAPRTFQEYGYHDRYA